MGGLGIPKPCKLADKKYENSLKVNAVLTQCIIDRNEHEEINLEEQQKLRTEAQLQSLSSPLREDSKWHRKWEHRIGLLSYL